MLGLAALGDPTRQRIMEMLAGGGMYAGDIASHLPISAPAVSQHLKILRTARLVRVQVQAQQRFYELDLAGLDEVAAWLAHIRGFWSSRLDALDEQLTRQKLKTKGKRK